MRVVHVIDSLGPGGAERSVLELVVGLRRDGVDVHLVALRSETEGFEDEARASGVPFSVIGAGSFVARVAALRRALLALRPDVVHATLPSSVTAAGLASVGSGAAVVASLTSAVPRAEERLLFGGRGWRSAARLRLYRLVSRLRVRCVHATTAAVAEVESLRWWIPADRVRVVERGRDRERLGEPGADRRAAVRRSEGIAESAPLVVVGARLSRQKHLLALLEAWRAVTERLPGALLLLVGRPDDDAPTVHSAAETMVAAGSVRLLGFRDDLPDLLAAADATALSSLIEGGAGVLIEAMALGVPIVCTDVAGLRSVLVHDHNALVVPQGDTGAFADALERVLTDRDVARRLTDNGRRTFEDRFTIDGAVTRMIDLYREATGRVA